MSDDDILLAGALQKLRLLLAGNSDLLFCFVNGLPFYGTYPNCEKPFPPIIRLDRTLVTRSSDEFIETVWVWATFLSAFFVERTAWVGVDRREAYIGTDIYLTHVLYRLLALQPGRTKIVTSEPLIAARMEYTGSFRIFFAFGLQFMKLLCDDAPKLGFKVDSLRTVKAKTIRRGLPPMIMMVRRGQRPRRLTWSEVRMLFAYTWWEPAAWLYLLPLVVLPGRMLDGILSARHYFRRQAPVRPIGR